MTADFCLRPARFRIFPVGADKAPLISGWQNKASRDPKIINQWQSNGVQAWGIPCGAINDLFVIDLDVDKETGEALGEASLSAIARYAALLDKPCVLTPSGGRHIYFRHFEGARNTTSKIGLKIDTRGEGGYVVASGSITEQGKYIGCVPRQLDVVPSGLRAMLMRSPMPLAHSPVSRSAPKQEVEDLLSFIPADENYEQWLSVLMALHDRFGGSEEGLLLADKWSQTGEKYRPGEVARKWKSFGRSGVTWATVPALARRYGADLSEIAKRWVT